MTIGLKRHYPARGRVSAGWRPRSGFNNAVPSMVGSLEVVRSGLGWDPLMGRRLGPSADEQRASVCARARARCQWRQLANYTGRLHPIADVGHLRMYVGEALNVCYEEGKKEGEENEVKHSKRSSLCRWCFIVSPASVLLGVLSDFRAVSFGVYLCVLASSECSRMGGPGPRSSDRIL